MTNIERDRSYVAMRRRMNQGMVTLNEERAAKLVRKYQDNGCASEEQLQFASLVEYGLRIRKAKRA